MIDAEIVKLLSLPDVDVRSTLSLLAPSLPFLHATVVVAYASICKGEGGRSKLVSSSGLVPIVRRPTKAIVARLKDLSGIFHPSLLHALVLP